MHSKAYFKEKKMLYSPCDMARPSLEEVEASNRTSVFFPIPLIQSPPKNGVAGALELQREYHADTGGHGFLRGSQIGGVDEVAREQMFICPGWELGRVRRALSVRPSGTVHYMGDLGDLSGRFATLHSLINSVS